AFILTPDISRDALNLRRPVRVSPLQDDRHQQAALVTESELIKMIFAIVEFSFFRRERLVVSLKSFTIGFRNGKAVPFVVKILKGSVCFHCEIHAAINIALAAYRI